MNAYDILLPPPWGMIYYQYIIYCPYKRPRPIGVMDRLTCLPKDILAHVVSFADRSDLAVLVRTHHKTANVTGLAGEWRSEYERMCDAQMLHLDSYEKMVYKNPFVSRPSAPDLEMMTYSYLGLTLHLAVHLRYKMVHTVQRDLDYSALRACTGRRLPALKLLVEAGAHISAMDTTRMDAEGHVVLARYVREHMMLPQTIMIDEHHRLPQDRGPSISSDTLYTRLFMKMPKIIMMSATPIDNSPVEIERLMGLIIPRIPPGSG